MRKLNLALANSGFMEMTPVEVAPAGNNPDLFTRACRN